MPEEKDLVERAKQHDQEAFTVLYDMYFDKIYRYIKLKVGIQVEAEDMAQQVFLKAFKSISSFRWRNVPFSAWLFKIAHNQVVDYFRKKTRTSAVSLDDIVVVSDSNPQEAAELSISLEQLTVAMGRLTPAQREVISLRFAGELPIAQVAEIMDRSQGAVKALQHSAIVSLRKIMCGAGADG